MRGANRKNSPPDTWWQTLHVGVDAVRVNFKLDTGAQVSVLPWQQFRRLADQSQLIPTTKSVVSYSGQKLAIAGTCELQCKIPGRRECYTIKFYVVHTTAPPILGLQECLAMSLITRSEEGSAALHSLQSEEETVIRENADLFDGKQGKINAVQALRFRKGQEPPPKIFPPRRAPIRLRDQIRKQLNAMEKRGIISRVMRSTAFVLPIVTVSKQDGTLRLCLDPRYINPHLQRKTFPMGKAEELLAALSGARYYTVLDGDSAFWHLPLDAASRDLCTFSTQ